MKPEGRRVTERLPQRPARPPAELIRISRFSLSSPWMIRETTLDQKLLMTLLAAFAGMAVVLATIRLYGVVSWGVSQGERDRDPFRSWRDQPRGCTG